MKRIFSATTLFALALGPALAANLRRRHHRHRVHRRLTYRLPFALQLDGVLSRPEYRWGSTSLSVNDTLGNSYSNSANQGQFFGGGQVGFNYQFPMGVVIGAEWQFDWLPNASNTGNGTAIPGVGIFR